MTPKMRLFPNPSSSEVETYWDVLRRCRGLATVETVMRWAKQYGVYDLANAASKKARTIKRQAR
jgi:hypothetical protein